MAKRAVGLGLLSDEDLEQATPDSYFRTIPDKDKLIARSDQFFAKHVPYWQGQLQGEYAASRERINSGIAKLQNRIDTLNQTPEQCVMMRRGSIHDLRHSFASVGAGHGLPIIGKSLGHIQAATTARYAHRDNDPLRRASEAIATKISAAMEKTAFSTTRILQAISARGYPARRNSGY